MSHSSTHSPHDGATRRGVTASDLERAADELLRQGSRPTIEKVRAAIGSGSPNTIDPLLDAWWQRLAGRLDAGPAALHRLPEAVVQVAEALWLQALDEARTRALLELRSSADAASEAEQSIEVRSRVLALREAELSERTTASERAAQETRDLLSQLSTTTRRDQATARARNAQIAALEAEVARYRKLHGLPSRAVGSKKSPAGRTKKPRPKHQSRTRAR